MRVWHSLDQIAAQCEQRAAEVKSDGDRAQLMRIAERLRGFSRYNGGNQHRTATPLHVIRPGEDRKPPETAFRVVQRG